MLKKKLQEKLFSLNFSNQTKEIERKQAKLEILQDKILEWNQKATKIQSNFDFTIPNYIIDEIIENEVKNDYINLHFLINCAVITGRISESNGKLIKEIYC